MSRKSLVSLAAVLLITVVLAGAGGIPGMAAGDVTSPPSLQVTKYELTWAEQQSLNMPIDSKIMTVQICRGYPCLWALARTDTPLESKRLLLVATSQPFQELWESLSYIGTFQAKAQDYHLFLLLDYQPGDDD
jgi:hypothetical protein